MPLFLLLLLFYCPFFLFILITPVHRFLVILCCKYFVGSHFHYSLLLFSPFSIAFHCLLVELFCHTIFLLFSQLRISVHTLIKMHTQACRGRGPINLTECVREPPRAKWKGSMGYEISGYRLHMHGFAFFLLNKVPLYSIGSIAFFCPTY